MGNIIATIWYDPVNHELYDQLINDCMKRHGMIEARQPEYKQDKKGHSVEICGLYLFWLGDKVATEKLKKFVDECERELIQHGATGVTSDIIHLSL